MHMHSLHIQIQQFIAGDMIAQRFVLSRFTGSSKSLELWTWYPIILTKLRSTTIFEVEQ